MPLLDTLKEKGDLLQTEHKKLFGEKFQTYITDTVKLRQKSEELLRDMNKKKPVRQPFRSGPPQQGKQSYSGGSKVVFTKKADYGYQQRPNSSGKYTSQRGIILQHVCNAPRPRDIQSNTPCNKRVIFRKNATCKHGGKAILFCQKLTILLTQDQSALSIVRGYKLQFLREPCQHKLPHVTKMSVAQAQLVQQEIIDMLKKGAIHKVSPVQGEFLSNLFLVDKKSGAHRPVINMKHLNTFIPYQHFKMEGLHLLKDLLQEGDYMCKLDL